CHGSNRCTFLNHQGWTNKRPDAGRAFRQTVPWYDQLSGFGTSTAAAAAAPPTAIATAPPLAQLIRAAPPSRHTRRCEDFVWFAIAVSALVSHSIVMDCCLCGRIRMNKGEYSRLLFCV